MRLFNLCVLVVLMVICLFVAFVHPDPPFSRGGRGRGCVSRSCRSRWDRMQMPSEDGGVVEFDRPYYPDQPAPSDGGDSMRNYLHNDILIKPIIIMPGATLSPDVMENLEANQ
ncbi:uncharacterized protein [Panulirus ornatus]|uniref:uncharacterized protein isoform X2 n=1 Tax=Panulirus ornatus TaxID=150431 RepID=UPI003A87A8AB